MENDVKIINQKLMIVLGMHRSGTSAITRGLEVLGVSLGSKLMPPAEGINNKGFFEDVEINALNIEILKYLGDDWLSLSPIEPDAFKSLRQEGYIIRAVELLRKKIESVDIFCFKDPRVSRILPFWIEAAEQLNLDVSYLIALRNPLSVVKSLLKRNGFLPEYSYLLWTRHLLDSLIESHGRPRIIVDFDRLIKSPESELDRIAEFFNLKLNSIELDHYKNQFLDPDLCHTVFSQNDLMLDLGCPPIVKEMFARLSIAASDQASIETVEMQSEIKQWSIEFERMKSTLILVDTQYNEIVNLNQLMNERQIYSSELSSQLKMQNDQIEKLHHDLHAQNSKIVTLTQKLLDTKSRLKKEMSFFKSFYLKVKEVNKIINEKGGVLSAIRHVITKIKELGLVVFLKNINSLLNERSLDTEDLN